MADSSQHFRCQVGDRPAEGSRALGALQHALLGETEVGKQRVAVLVQHNVVRLQVSVDDVPLVQVLQRQ